MQHEFDRRSFIRRALAAALTLTASRSQAQGGRKPPAGTLAEALETNDRSAVARFITASPRISAAADLRERVAALRLMAHGTTSHEEMEARLRSRQPGAPDAGKSAAACLACQGASFELVRAASNDPRALQAYIDGVGGRAWLESALATFEHRGLQSEVRAGLETAGRGS
jgi:hypothetical protein